MDKIMQFLEAKLLGPLNKMANTKFIRALMNAGLATIPFTIVGSIFLILNNLPQIIPPLKTFFEATILNYSAVYSVANTMALGSIAIYYVAATGYYFTEEYRNRDGLNLNSFNGAILSLFAFLMTIIQVTIVNGKAMLVTDLTQETSVVFNGVSVGGWITRFSGQGIFVGIITAVLAVQIYRLCVVKNFTIKMPEGVPEGVTRSFAALVPAIIIAFVMIFINLGLAFMGTDVHAMLSKPFGFVQGLAGSYPGVLVIMILIHLLWAVGVHGTSIIKNTFVNPILLVALTQNIDGASNVFAGDFVNMYLFIGGAGSTLGLCLLFMFKSRSATLKTLGKASIVPAMFNINEPIIFGAPIVYNPYLMIPFIIAPLVNVTLAYFATYFGLVGKVVSGIPWVSPVGIGAFLGTGGDFRAVILAFVCLFASTLIYYPFFKMYDNKLYLEETQPR
ncbi:PTS cellobiose transporter subunit IIC [Erysipelothrix sp. HDW6C]|uniref:PTS cellobiose transporter subunit IIC n=1 Tax=Erysipelothrix sp. HDW6C TaxID=2714930 RepID=UPI00140DAE5B|nr:PTS cellobiose transporter subunit IIC [Erysipelothrix sp. HDW6C]QIK68834.1 PTS cellobiose transporter subunit IIC [Erysipelothrix sp. HDW6C]